MVKTDSNGVSLWEKTYGGTGSEYGTGILNTAEDGFIIVGYTDSYGAESTDCFLDVIHTSDSGYLAVGFSASFGAEGLDLYLVKTDGIGLMTGISKSHSNSIPSYKLFSSFPNPFNPSTIIKFTLPKSDYVELNVYNILGKEVAQLVSENLSPGVHQYEFNGSGLASGIYYYQIIAGDYREVKKMMLIREPLPQR